MGRGSERETVFLRLEESVIFQKEGRGHSHFSYLLQCRVVRKNVI